MPGIEEALIKQIVDNVSYKEADVKVDNMNNLIISCIHGEELPTVVLSAHMDEPGFIITDITDDGYLKFETIGDIKPSDIISKKIKIGELTGIISLKAIHLTTKEEREKLTKISDLLIDVGAETKSEACKIARPGDYCSFEQTYSRFGEGLFKGKALSSRSGCKALIDIINNNKFSNLNLVCIFATQKEVASRGARVALNSVSDVNFAIIVDSVETTENIHLSNGVAIGYRNDDNAATRAFVKSIENINSNNQIIQKVCCDNIKSDLNMFKSCKADMPSILLALPCKHKNSATEVIAESDFNALYELIFNVLSEVNNGALL